MDVTKPLRLVGTEEGVRKRRGPWDLGVYWPAQDVEKAIEDVQLRIDDLRAMLHPPTDDDRPRAA